MRLARGLRCAYRALSYVAGVILWARACVVDEARARGFEFDELDDELLPGWVSR